jgi:hypothetical protein
MICNLSLTQLLIYHLFPYFNCLNLYRKGAFHNPLRIFFFLFLIENQKRLHSGVKQKKKNKNKKQIKKKRRVYFGVKQFSLVFASS